MTAIIISDPCFSPIITQYSAFAVDDSADRGHIHPSSCAWIPRNRHHIAWWMANSWPWPVPRLGTCGCSNCWIQHDLTIKTGGFNLFSAIQLSNSVGFIMKYMDLTWLIHQKWWIWPSKMVMKSPMTKHLEILLIHIIYIYIMCIYIYNMDGKFSNQNFGYNKSRNKSYVCFVGFMLKFCFPHWWSLTSFLGTTSKPRNFTTESFYVPSGND